MNVILAMMAKAPEWIVLRAIESARPFVQSVCLVVAPDDPLLDYDCELGSRKHALPIWVEEEPWQGYAKTRTRTLEIAGDASGVDWVLMIDAYSGVFGEMPPLDDPSVDAYEVAVYEPLSQWRWMRPWHLTRARRDFRFEGDLHEALVIPPGAHVASWGRLTVSGSASPKTNANRTRSYDEDVTTLRTVVDNPMATTRSWFYFAQSLKDAGRDAEAFDAYGTCASMGGWDEEVFWSRMWQGILTEKMNRPGARVFYQAAAQLLPERAEPHAALFRLLVKAGEREQAKRAAARAASKPFPVSARLFVDCKAYSSEAIAAAGVVLPTF